MPTTRSESSPLLMHHVIGRISLTARVVLDDLKTHKINHHDDAQWKKFLIIQRKQRDLNVRELNNAREELRRRHNDIDDPAYQIGRHREQQGDNESTLYDKDHGMSEEKWDAHMNEMCGLNFR